MQGKKSGDMEKIIFATSSPQRKGICRRHGINCSFEKSGVEEMTSGASAREVAMSNAMKKAKAVAKANPEAIVIGADTVVSIGNRIIGKPENARDARCIMAMLSGKSHKVITGVCLVKGQKTRRYHDASTVRFKKLPKPGLEKYVSSGKWRGKAGGYGIQSGAKELIAGMKGSEENVEGLDGERLKKEVLKFARQLKAK